MRRIDVIGIGVGIFATGGMLYLFLGWAGLEPLSAGLWSQVIFLGAVLGWVLTYLGRVVTHNMTFHRQMYDYEEAVLQKRLDELSPEELQQIQAEIEQERQAEASAPNP
jgi:hypothetical protein